MAESLLFRKRVNLLAFFNGNEILASKGVVRGVDWISAEIAGSFAFLFADNTTAGQAIIDQFMFGCHTITLLATWKKIAALVDVGDLYLFPLVLLFVSSVSFGHVV